VLAENLICSSLDLECASSNDQTFTHSDMRRTARLLMQFLPGTDFISSGYSAVPNYDNMFAGSNEDAEDFDDYNVIQRDLKVDGGLRPVREEDVIAIRNKAARALQAVFAGMGCRRLPMKKWKPRPTPTVRKICRSATSSKTSSSPRRSSIKTATAWKW
jgi:propanediol dehydratase large subunit